MIIENPILRGFNPDPSICFANGHYYLATSTFEWFPGVQIHVSKDLKHWKLLGGALTRRQQLDLTGISPSGGVWAPDISYCDGVFYLIYSIMRNHIGAYKDVHNYLVTTKDPETGWSDPVYLNSSGFDPSLFHAPDGRKWIVNQLHDSRPGKKRFAGIVLQEYCPERQTMVGPVKNIFKGCIGITEGPHIYFQNGFYYLLTAEGGTGWDHAVTIARSENIDGPYEVDPTNPVLTAKNQPFCAIKCAGHGDLFETPDGWYMVHLGARPVVNGVSVLARETSLQKMVYTEDGWFRMANGGNSPDVVVECELPEQPWDLPESGSTFYGNALDVNLNTLRVPPTEHNLSLSAREGFLRLFGRESLSSCFDTTLVARRQQAFTCTAETNVEFAPENDMQSAGLVFYRDTGNFTYLRIGFDEKLGKTISIMTILKNNYTGTPEIPLDFDGPVQLRVEVDYEIMRFSYRTDGDWKPIGGKIDTCHFSDERALANFSGNFIGICCQDLSGLAKHADFSYFCYEEQDM